MYNFFAKLSKARILYKSEYSYSHVNTGRYIYIAMNTNFLFIYSGSWHKCQKNPSRQAQLQIASHIAPEKDN